MLRDMIADDFEPNNKGFNSISIFPEGLLGKCCYGNFSDGGLGIFLSYQGKSHNETTLENLLDVYKRQEKGIQVYQVHKSDF